MDGIEIYFLPGTKITKFIRVNDFDSFSIGIL